jgi:(p)ppGpp synthase/HD superfamily hydrolase
VGPSDESEAELGSASELPLTRDAIAFAADRHKDQRRSADGAEFIAHPLEVASLLRRAGYPDHVVAAAVLHDVLEDTDVDRDELERRFGSEVADLVELVSDDPSISDQEAQKDDVRERVRRGGAEARAIYAADKISKVRELRTPRADGLPAAEAEAKRRRYREALRMLEGENADPRLVALLRQELEALERSPSAGA